MINIIRNSPSPAFFCKIYLQKSLYSFYSIDVSVIVYRVGSGQVTGLGRALNLFVGLIYNFKNVSWSDRWRRRCCPNWPFILMILLVNGLWSINDVVLEWERQLIVLQKLFKKKNSIKIDIYYVFSGGHAPNKFIFGL